jgi:hypothetical protein
MAGTGSSFDRARLLACGDSCGHCGKFKQFPDGVALFEEPYCEPIWLCKECYPCTESDDDES